MAWVKFLVVAVVVMAACLGGLGGFLLPRMGVSTQMAQWIAAGIGGGSIAIIMMVMKPGRPA